MRSQLLLFVLVASVAHMAMAQDDPPQVDQAEVMRLGDMVQHVGYVQSDEGADAFVAAMSPPESDADKWFISVITMQGCGACEKLKHDWATNEWLLSLANPANPKKSWAHYRVYDKDDLSQAFRWKNVKITAYPTIIVQPPRSGQFGNPATVVYQGVYQGDPEKLAARSAPRSGVTLRSSSDRPAKALSDRALFRGNLPPGMIPSHSRNTRCTIRPFRRPLL